jgi:hypothetical protein
MKSAVFWDIKYQSILILSTLIMEATWSSETSNLSRDTRSHIPEEGSSGNDNFLSHRSMKLRDTRNKLPNYILPFLIRCQVLSLQYHKTLCGQHISRKFNIKDSHQVQKYRATHLTVHPCSCLQNLLRAT